MHRSRRLSAELLLCASPITVKSKLLRRVQFVAYVIQCTRCWICTTPQRTSTLARRPTADDRTLTWRPAAGPPPPPNEKVPLEPFHLGAGGGPPPRVRGWVGRSACGAAKPGGHGKSQRDANKSIP